MALMAELHVVVSEAEIEDIGRQQPTTPREYWPGLALAKKGVRFKPTFNPFRESDMLPPWRVWVDPSTRDLHVWQGEPT